MGAVMGTFSSLQTKQRRPSKGKHSVLCLLPWIGLGVLGVVLGCNVCLLVPNPLTVKVLDSLLYPRSKNLVGGLV